MDMFKKMCIGQGYVPETCTMDGQLCWMLVNSQGDPCKDCNENRNICICKTYNENEENYSTSKNRIRENQLRQEEKVRKRKEEHTKMPVGTILEIEHDVHRRKIEVTVKDIAEERAYITRCGDIDHMLSVVSSCCGKYRVSQIHVDVSGYGMPVYEALVEHIKGVDIVPLRYVAMTF